MNNVVDHLNLDLINLPSTSQTSDTSLYNNDLWISDDSINWTYVRDAEYTLHDDAPIEIIDISSKHNLLPSQEDLDRYAFYDKVDGEQQHPSSDDSIHAIEEFDCGSDVSSITSPSMPSTPILGATETPLQLEFPHDTFTLRPQKRKASQLDWDGMPEDDYPSHPVLVAGTARPTITRKFA